MSIFNTLDNISVGKDTSKVPSADYNPFMIGRFLSMSVDHIVYASIANREMKDVPKEFQELFMLHIIPKKKAYFKYKKNTKTKSDSLTFLKEKYKLSDQKASEAIEFMNRLEEKRNGF